MQRAIVVREPTKETLKTVMEIMKSAYEAGLDAGDEEYVRGLLFDSKNVHIFLEDDGKDVGYLMVVPHNTAYDELKDDDLLMTKDSERYYINLIIIIRQYQRPRAILKLLKLMFDEVKERFGIDKFSLHCRTTNGLSHFIQKVFGDTITLTRHIDRWKYAGKDGEPYDYIEGGAP
jgi:hypothetical protein